MPSRSPALLLGLLAVGATGCELVFGLDDYARDPAGAGGGSTATAGSGGSDGGAEPSGGGPSTATTSTGSGATASTGGPTSCQCVPPIPAGWSLVTRTDGELGGPEATCTGAERLAVGTPSSSCTCACGAAAEATCEGARLKCYQEGGCVGTVTEVDLDGACTDLGAEYRSCEALPASASGPTCEATATAGALVGDAVDLCPASTTIEASCGGEGVCATVEDGQRTCIRGEGSCPAGWTGQALDAHQPGEATCDTCSCTGRSCSEARYLASVGPITCEAGTGAPIGESCTSVVQVGIASSHAKRLDASTLEGECVAEAPTVGATYAPGAAVSVCCLPPTEG